MTKLNDSFVNHLDKSYSSIGTLDLPGTRLALNDFLIKENRKVMSHVLKKINELKHKSYSIENIIKECNQIITNYLNNRKQEHTLFTLFDEDGNTCNNLWIKKLNSVLHRCVLKEKTEFSQIILEIYDKKLEDKSELIKWIETRNNHNITALDIAAQKNHKEAIHLIYSYYEKNNLYLVIEEGDYSNVFHQASKKNEIYPIIFFYEKLKDHYSHNVLNIKNKNGMIPLHHASHSGNKRIIDILLDLHSDINSQDNNGDSPLHLAVKNSCKNLIENLNSWSKDY